LKHAANRREDAKAYLDQYPGRGLEYIWESHGERQRVTVDRQFLYGMEKAVNARARDLADTGPQGEWQAEHILFDATAKANDPFGPDDPNAPK